MYECTKLIHQSYHSCPMGTFDESFHSCPMGTFDESFHSCPMDGSDESNHLCPMDRTRPALISFPHYCGTKFTNRTNGVDSTVLDNPRLKSGFIPYFSGILRWYVLRFQIKVFSSYIF